jgi:hypothetical protein
VSSPGILGEDHGTREALGSATRKNSPVYGDRHVVKVVSGTRETLTRTGMYSRKERTYKPER